MRMYMYSSNCYENRIYEQLHEKTCFLHNAKTKAQISCAVTMQLISAFVFTTYIVQSLYFLNLKIQAYNNNLWLYSLICVGMVGNPEDRFSHNSAHIIEVKSPHEKI